MIAQGSYHPSDPAHDEGPLPSGPKTDVWSLGVLLFELCAVRVFHTPLHTRTKQDHLILFDLLFWSVDFSLVNFVTGQTPAAEY